MSRGIEGHFRPEFVLLTFDKPTDAGTWIFCGFWWEDDDAISKVERAEPSSTGR